MGCIHSKDVIDFDFIQPTVLRIKGGLACFNGTSERGPYQALGDAEMALTEDCLYSQVMKTSCCNNRSVLRIPILSIRDIRQQANFNGLYRLDHFHMVITYVIRDAKGKKEYQAAWQVNNATYNQWKTAILNLRDRHPTSELA